MIVKNESGNNDEASNEKLDNKVIPIMRDAVALVQLVLFGELKKSIDPKYQDWQIQEKKWLAGAVVNNLFGVRVSDVKLDEFSRKNREIIEEELRGIKEGCPDLLSYLTDALRMQTLCDEQDGINSLSNLLLARALGILVEDRPIPMPSTFMIFVRQLGARYGLLETLNSSPED